MFLGGRIDPNWCFSWELRGFIKDPLSLRIRCKVREMLSGGTVVGDSVVSIAGHSPTLSYSFFVLVWPEAMPITSYWNEVSKTPFLYNFFCLCWHRPLCDCRRVITVDMCCLWFTIVHVGLHRSNQFSINPKDGSDTFVRNIGNHMQDQYEVWGSLS